MMQVRQNGESNPDPIIVAHPDRTRRSMLHSAIAGLAAFATSFFVAERSYACTDCFSFCAGYGGPNCELGEGRCLKYHNDCCMQPVHAYKLYWGAANETNCCVEEPELEDLICHMCDIPQQGCM